MLVHTTSIASEAAFVDINLCQNELRKFKCHSTQSPLSEEISKALKKRGFKFVGPVIVYAWMRAVGIVNDHTSDCFRRRAVEALEK